MELSWMIIERIDAGLIADDYRCSMAVKMCLIELVAAGWNDASFQGIE